MSVGRPFSWLWAIFEFGLPFSMFIGNALNFDIFHFCPNLVNKNENSLKLGQVKLRFFFFFFFALGGGGGGGGVD
jgi:hypothetical protein